MVYGLPTYTMHGPMDKCLVRIVLIEDLWVGMGVIIPMNAVAVSL
jgi:hypothetical protein